MYTLIQINNSDRLAYCVRKIQWPHNHNTHDLRRFAHL